MTKYIYDDGVFKELPSYIYQNRHGGFEIRKRIGGVLQYYGCFSTLEEAMLYRAYYIGKGWRVNPSFRSRQYIIRKGDKFMVMKYIDGERVSFGTFDCFEDAQRERDVCVRCGWDFDLIVEAGL